MLQYAFSLNYIKKNVTIVIVFYYGLVNDPLMNCALVNWKFARNMKLRKTQNDFWVVLENEEEERLKLFQKAK